MTPHRWFIALVSRIVPKSLRPEWRAEWDAELSHREASVQRWRRPDREAHRDLFRRSAGAFWDALWLQSSHWYSMRLMARHWRLALTALLSLATGIAAMVIGLATSNALLLRPPGVTDSRALLTLHAGTAADPYGAVSFEEFRYYRDNTQAFSGIAAFPYSVSTLAFHVDDRNQQVVATEVSDNYFPVLGINPRFGHLNFFGDGDDVVLSYPFWTRIGSDPQIVGTTIRLNDHAVTVAGVTPQTFGRMLFVWEPDIWMPFKTGERVIGTPPRMLTDRTERWLHMVGRLKPGVSTAQARTDVTLLSARIEHEHPDTDRGRSAILAALTVVPPGDRPWVSLLSGSLVIVVLLVLVVAGANVTNLLLGLSTARRHEMLVRAALGASRLQLVMPLLRESAGLALLSGALGYAAAYGALARMSSLQASLGTLFPVLPPPAVDLRPDFSVLVLTIAIVIVAGVAVGLAPSWRAAADGVSGALGRELIAGEPRKNRIRSVLVVIQMAVATLAVMGVGASFRGLRNLEQAPLGFSARNLVFTGVDMRRSGYDERTGRAFYERLRQRVAAMPEIEAVSLVDGPAMGNGFGRDQVLREQEVPEPGHHGADTRYSVVDDRYFSTVGMPVIGGRTFSTADRAGAPEVVVVNATMARLHWRGRDPVGQRLRVARGNRLVQVIGVVADGKYESVDEPALPFMYFALDQHYRNDIVAIARTRDSQPPGDLVGRALRESEPHVVFGGLGLMSLEQLLALQLLLPRAIVVTVIAFSALTLALATVGLYGVVFYSVSQRRQEMGIRIALGALPRDLFLIVLRRTAGVAAAGAGLGVAIGSASLPLAASMFYGLRTVEPAVIAVAVCVSTAVALVTAYVAARPWTRMAAIDLGRP